MPCWQLTKSRTTRICVFHVPEPADRNAAFLRRNRSVVTRSTPSASANSKNGSGTRTGRRHVGSETAAMVAMLGENCMESAVMILHP